MVCAATPGTALVGPAALQRRPYRGQFLYPYTQDKLPRYYSARSINVITNQDMFQSLFLLSSKHQYLYKSRHVSEFILTHHEASISLQIKTCFRIYFYSARSINIFTHQDMLQSLFLLSSKHQYLYKSRHVSEFVLTQLEASISLQIKTCFRVYSYSARSINIFTNPDMFQSLF